MFKGKKILVVGLARSGMAAVKALHKRGAVLFAYDAKTEKELPAEAAWLKDLGVKIFLGTYPPLHQGIDLLVVSPGVPLDIDPVQEAYRRGIRVIGELELAFLLKSPQVEMLAVTGTNGKTTTTALLEMILKTDGRNAAAAGNIGVPLCSLIEEMESGYIAVEASSFQLESTQSFNPHVAGILNITPDHLDRHKSMQGYIQAKRNIFKNHTAADYLILNYDDEIVRNLALSANSQVIFFSVEQELAEGFYIAEQSIQVNWGGEHCSLLSLPEIRLRGKHNLENILCAAAMAWADGVSPASIISSLRNFGGVRHRLEEVTIHNNILYINDSKGTNPESTMKALQAFDDPIVLIAGGRSKGGSFTALAELIPGKVKELVLLGEAREQIKSAVMELGYRNIHEVEDFPAAVYLAQRLAEPGDVVLLSPACASWDMFPSYEHRGDLFCELVGQLVNETFA
ncbi:UDP-N-acetylmuramoylalanine-D-glutamate ligase [Syntrophomonas zehnderi OL-4]|uniref:UDP-N-acetylmuramoylalanine--D-glutamate ligase n=1 Tax=Syntrophomonas zehnderi OL-4 TaxID=690567 RepID=A0A0E4GAS6_9FIRM|nr:UDP-N-acetylmuramoyl-L-alanine--D-glutamate ligase [Syntrophomonas zehnderi]CFX62833.1 UDP-N-acetylmuramoylalanine-D-glutamate ligase [Syntrophomonas zehnderi OL-4]